MLESTETTECTSDCCAPVQQIIDLIAMGNFIASLDDPKISGVSVYGNTVQVSYQF